MIRIGNQILILSAPVLTLEWKPERDKWTAGNRTRAPRVLGYRLKVSAAWNTVPDMLLSDPGGGDSWVSGSRALALIKRQNIVMFSKTGRDPWIEVTPEDAWIFRDDKSGKPQPGALDLISVDLFGDFLAIDDQWEGP